MNINLPIGNSVSNMFRHLDTVCSSRIDLWRVFGKVYSWVRVTSVLHGDTTKKPEPVSKMASPRHQQTSGQPLLPRCGSRPFAFTKKKSSNPFLSTNKQNELSQGGFGAANG